MRILDDIVTRKREEVEALKRAPLPMPETTFTPRGDLFKQSLKKSGLSIIAEVKRRSPSAGNLNEGIDPAVQAVRYATGGADAISVLTDSTFFGGSLTDLSVIRRGVALPVLRKDFIIHPIQMEEAARFGADAVLLIVRILSDAGLKKLLKQAKQLNLAALVEVHSRPELQRAVSCGASIIGVNNRNLDTLAIDLQTSLDLRKEIPPGKVTVAESGVKTPEDTRRLRRAGYDAVLVGETLMKARDPRATVSQFKGGADE